MVGLHLLKKACSGRRRPHWRRNPKMDAGHVDWTILNPGLFFIWAIYITANILNRLLHFYESFQVHYLSKMNWIETIFIRISFNRNEHFSEIPKVFRCTNSPLLMPLLILTYSYHDLTFSKYDATYLSIKMILRHDIHFQV